MTRFLVSALLLSLGWAVQPAPAADRAPGPEPHYDIRLRLDPADRWVEVTGTVTLPREDTVVFFLHRQLEVRSFGGGAVGLDTTDHGVRYLPEAVRVRVAAAAGAGDRVRIPFEYAGTITEWPEWSASVIGPEWTELGVYFPWFPYHPDLRPFTYRLKVVHDPVLTVSAMGAREEGDSTTTFHRAVPTNDIVVAAAPDLQVAETRQDEGVFRVAETELGDATVDSILADVSWLQQFYGSRFGPVTGDLLLLASERERGGGYARMGGIFLAGLEDDAYLENRVGYLRYIGHELAHLWWYRADTNTWEDWLNESLAEYSALLAIRGLAGPAEYERRLAAKRETARGTPPIRGFDRNGEHAEAVLYSKGPVLLAELERRIGADAFRAFARALFQQEVATTDRFLDALGTREGPATRRWFEEQLRTR